MTPETVTPDTKGRDHADSRDGHARNRRVSHLSIIAAAAVAHLRGVVDGDTNRKLDGILRMSESA
jgi:hypothetical protein